MDNATGQLGNYGSEISDLVPRKNGARFAINKVSEFRPAGRNSDNDTVCFTLPGGLVYAELSKKTPIGDQSRYNGCTPQVFIDVHRNLYGRL